MGVPGQSPDERHLKNLKEGLPCWIAPQSGLNVTTGSVVTHLEDTLEIRLTPRNRYGTGILDAGVALPSAAVLKGMAPSWLGMHIFPGGGGSSSSTARPPEDQEPSNITPPRIMPLYNLGVTGPEEDGPYPWSSLSVTLWSREGAQTLIFSSDIDARIFAECVEYLQLFTMKPASPWERPAASKWELPGPLRRITGAVDFFSSVKNTTTDVVAKVLFADDPDLENWTRDDWLREEGERCERWEHYYERDRFPELLVYMGLPFGRRGELWTKWVKQYEFLEENQGITDDIIREIDVDLPRTLPAQLTKANVVSLRNILIEVAKRRGYCQGLNYLASVPLLVGMDEESSIRLLNFISLRACIGYHDDEHLTGFLRDAYVCEKLLARLRPDHYMLLESFNVSMGLVISEAFMTLFSRSLPLALVAWMWDNILFFGSRALFAIFIGFWDSGLFTALEKSQDPTEVQPFISIVLRSPEAARAAVLKLPTILPMIPATLIDSLRGEALERDQDTSIFR